VISGVALFRLNRADTVRLKRALASRLLARVPERYVDKHCLAFRQADLASEVTDEDEKVRQLR
jgi:hypothetical protein